MPEQKLKEEKKEEYDQERKRRELEKRKREKEEKKGVEKVSEVKPPARSIIQKTTETEVKVPILKLEKPKIEVKEIKLSKDIPHIERKELEVKVPIIKLFTPMFEEGEIKLNKNVPSIEPIDKELKIPLVKLKETLVKCVILEFNSNIPEIRPRLRTRIRIPIYRILKPPLIREISLFDKKIDEKLLEELEEKTIQTPRLQVSVISKGAEPSLGGGEEIEEEPPEIIKFVFGNNSTRILSKGPIVILYKELENDSTIGSFETLCIRIFREKKGGEPGYFSIKNLDPYNIREVEKYIKPEGNIVRIDLDALKKDAEESKRNIFEIVSSERLRETLDRFIVGDVSFLIFKTRDEKLYEYCKQVLMKLSASVEHPLKIVEVIPQKISIEEKKILTELAWGLSIKGIETDIKVISSDRPIGTTLDDIFNKFGKTKHEEYLENLQKEKYGMYWDATKPHEGQESDLHRQIKTFIVKLLAKKHNLRTKEEIKEKVLTEKEVNGIKPDIYDTIEGTAYEIETLFSEDNEGKAPRDKLNETIEKYEETPIRKINIVLDNITFLIHIRDLFGIKRNIRDWENKTGKSVTFLTLDVENYKL
ncbi:MAG: hypothetical protein ACTSVB_08395, partial [Candidatus Heimdallarchaeaceae archaeon]